MCIDAVGWQHFVQVREHSVIVMDLNNSIFPICRQLSTKQLFLQKSNFVQRFGQSNSQPITNQTWENQDLTKNVGFTLYFEDVLEFGRI